MSEVINKNKYLDFAGLKKYDELIKSYIASNDNVLSDAIAALDAKIGSLTIEGSDDKNLTEIVSDIYTSIVDIIESQTSLEEKDKDLADQIKKIADDLEFITGSNSENEATLVEINETLSNINTELNSLKSSINKIDKDVSDAVNAVETIVDRIEDLERDGEIYKPSQSLVDATDLSSSIHGGLESHSAAWFKEQGYTYSEMFDQILFPTILPTMTEPSLNWKDYSTSYDILVGDDITNLVLTNDNINDYITADLGSWSLSTNEGMTASNDCGQIKVDATNGEPIDNENGTYSMGTSIIKYQAYAMFENGNDPMDNKGNICVDKGYFNNNKNVYSTEAYIYPYYNFYATTNQSEPGELVLQPIIRNAGIDTVTTQDSITLSPHTSTTPWKLKLPKELQTLWVLNTSNGKYEEIEMSGDAPRMWKHEQETKIENGIKYHIYTYVGSDNNSVNIQIKF
jgi:hypothetical protein